MSKRASLRLLSLAALVVVSLAVDGRAQGLQNGIVTGAVRSSDGLSLPGVTVTVSSTSLQGTRVDDHGHQRQLRDPRLAAG